MKRILSCLLSLILLLISLSGARAAELLDVKPIVSGSSVSVEVSADVSMTYTYYKVPGQARAVVDIADADPEKVEPLIVVNKGAVSSISVDKAQIAGMVVSRLVFNLVAESDVFVKPSPDRKLLTVTFGGASAGAVSPAPVPAPVKDVPEPDEKKADLEPLKKVAAASPNAASKEEDDPLGLDEPDASMQKKEAPVSASGLPKLAPIVPTASRSSHATSVRKIVSGKTFVDIQANGPVADFKVTRLSNPERLVIDLPGVRSLLTGKTVAINKFGVSKLRVGVYPEYVRIVVDASKSVFPKHTVTKIKDGLRISFK